MGSRRDPRPLHREEAKKLKHRKLIAWDIETMGRTVGDALFGDICPRGICALEGDTPYFFNSLQQFLQTCIERWSGYYLAAHNGKGYEFNYLKDVLQDYLDAHPNFECICVHQGDSIIGYQLIEHTSKTITRGKGKGVTRSITHTWYFIDTLPLFNMSLRKVAEAFAPGKPKGEVNWKKENWNYANPRHRNYIIRDCEIIRDSFSALETMAFELFHARPGITAGSTAVRAFKASIPQGHVYYRNNRHVEEFVRRAYRGGLVLPGSTTKILHDVTMLDVKGAYGYQMKSHEFPVGNPCHTFAYMPGRIGVYHVHVTTPDNLPFGIIGTEGTSCYPLGHFNTVVTSPEMEYASQLGYSFEVYEGYFWCRTEPVFHDFIGRCERLETEYVTIEGKKKQPYKPLAKLLRNSLYGKFCTKTKAERYHLLPRNAELPEDSAIILDPKTGDIVPGIYSQEEDVDENYIMPIWGVLITAYERIFLAQRAYALYAAGASSVYGDTDSIAADTTAINKVCAQGLFEEYDGYGSWEYEGRAHTMIVAAPKVYIMLDEQGKVLKARAKGLPLDRMAENEEKYPNIISLETYIESITNQRKEYTFVTSNSIKTRLKKPELPIKLERKRRMSFIANTPNWDYDARTRRITPKRVDESPLDMPREAMVCSLLETASDIADIETETG